MGGEVVVVGAGVSGLTTALVLQQRGLTVRIVAEKPPAETTSAVAAAVWFPYRAYPEDLVVGWGARTYAVLMDLARESTSGVRVVRAVELHRSRKPAPWWREAVPNVGSDVPGAFASLFVAANVFESPVADMSRYLDYLLRRFTTAGGNLEIQYLDSLAAAGSSGDIVVNCTGLGAQALTGDDSLFPIRGQVVRVANPGLDSFLLDEENPKGQTYIVPRFSDCILGGTSQDGDWNLSPDRATAEAILERCVELEPRLRGAEILEHRVGLRPGRPAVRIEREELPSGAICVHNYGHGGAGVTLSWGCALAAADLVTEV